MRSIESLLVNKGMGRGSSWSSLDLEIVESDVSSGKSAGAIARTVVGQAAVFVNVLLLPRYVGGSPRRLTPDLLDEIREFIEEENMDEFQ